MGWYSTGGTIYEYDRHIQKKLMAHNESPLYLLMDTVKASVSKELPLKIYESEVKVSDFECSLFDISIFHEPNVYLQNRL